MPVSPRIASLGTGLIGVPMTRNLLRAGLPPGLPVEPERRNPGRPA